MESRSLVLQVMRKPFHSLQSVFCSSWLLLHLLNVYACPHIMSTIQGGTTVKSPSTLAFMGERIPRGGAFQNLCAKPQGEGGQWLVLYSHPTHRSGSRSWEFSLLFIDRSSSSLK